MRGRCILCKIEKSKTNTTKFLYTVIKFTAWTKSVGTPTETTCSQWPILGKIIFQWMIN